MSVIRPIVLGALGCLSALVVSAALHAAPQDGLGETQQKKGPHSPFGGLGACCLGDGSCLMLPESSCDILIGNFMGVGTNCVDVICIPFGACCFTDISCVNTTAADCVILGGNYMGDAIKCALGLCPVQGACCLADGTCAEFQSEEQCVVLGGIYKGFQSECGTVTCTGACSFENRTCTDGVSQDDCTGASGNFLGGGSDCASSNIPAIVQCQTFSFDQNNIETRTFDQFDDMGGTRVLQKVTTILDGEIVAVVILTNLATVPKDNTDVFVVENLGIEMPSVAPIFQFPAIDILNQVIDCGFVLPAGASCDFGSPLTFAGSAMGMTVVPADLATFTGPGTIDASIPALGSFEFFGSKFSLENNPHLAQGKITLIYEYIVPGACCFLDGSCSDVDSEADCVALGGDFQGAGTVCTPVLCAQPACCLPDGSCAQLSAADCLAASGTPQAAGTICADIECPTACCLPDGSCIFVTPTECGVQGGVSQLGACASVECPTACCLPDGSCIFVTPTECGIQGGVSQAGSCASVECPTACCLPDGSCIFVTPTECGVQGGVSQLGACAAVECPTACCLPDGSCIFVTPTECGIQGGVSQAGACASVECPTACCLPDGSCIFVTPTECGVQGGVSQAGSCASVECPTACCLLDGSCIFVTPTQCGIQGGVSQAGSCASVECPTACCLPDGSCIFVTPTQCGIQGGVSQLGACADVECPTACCLPDGSCIFVTPTECGVQGGVSQAGACADVECPTACCLPDGSCVFVTPTECGVQGGVSQAGACADVECPRACCFPDGTCVFQTPTSCVADGGVPQDVGEICGVVICPVAEACCFPNGTCLDLTPVECTDAGGVPQGAGMLCADPVDCPAEPDRGGCTEKGSLLVFSKVEIRWAVGEGTALKQDTFLSLTNDYPGNVKVHMYFINGDAPLAEDVANGERAHQGWNWVDNSIQLTGNEPTYWSALTGLPKGVSPFTALDPGTPPGRPAMDGTDDRVLRGYVLAWAINSVGDEIRWNHLSGHGTLINYASTHAWEYNACAFQIREDLFAHNEATGTPGVLMLNGTEYAPAFDDLLLNFQAPTSNAFEPQTPPPTVVSDTDLTLHPITVDVRQNNDGPVTTKASMDIWNENESKFSGTHRCITCWDQTLISHYDTPNHFLKVFLQTDHGKARIEGHAADDCDVLDDPDTPEDETVTSIEAALLGVYARLFEFNADDFFTAASGGNLVGMGFENAMIQYDPTTPPPELLLPPDPTVKDIETFIDRLLREHGTETNRSRIER